MSRAEIIEYKCDVCGKLFRVENNPLRKPQTELKTISMPIKSYDCEGRNYSKSMGSVDVCEDCFNNYWEYVQSRYEVSDCYGMTVKIKGGAT